MISIHDNRQWTFPTRSPKHLDNQESRILSAIAWDSMNTNGRKPPTA